MKGFSALFVVLAILFACFAARAEASAAPGGADVRAVQAVQTSAAPLAPAAKPVKIGCKRGLPGFTPTPCGTGFAMPVTAPDIGSPAASAATGRSWARGLKSFRPKGLLDPPRSV